MADGEAAKPPAAVMPAAPESAAGPPAGPWSSRRFGLLLLTICLAGLLARGIILADYLRTNPLARTPLVDAGVYWEWAGEIAGGKLLAATPFLSAPLYPHVLGLLRALGGGLTTVYLVQILADVVTAGLLGWAARKRFGAGAGLLAASLFLLLRDPASFSLRVLAPSLHLLLVAVLYLLLAGGAERRTTVRLVAIGVTLGLLCLAYPPAVLLTVALGLWLFWESGRRARGAGRAALPVAIAALLVAPATLHNYLACKEFIPISAQAGVTFAQGNRPDSTAVYTAIPGVSANREIQNRDAFRLYERTTGQQPTWNAVNRFFFGQGLQYWRADPLRALQLLARKAYLFLSFRNYGDIYSPHGEIAYGLNPWLRLAPLPVPWLIGPAVVGLVLVRRPIRYAPEWLLLLLPLLVVVAFWYSPRYRIPAVPVIAVLAAAAIAATVQGRWYWGRGIAVIAALAAGILLAPLNRKISFDLTDPALVPMQLAEAFARQGHLADAAEKQREVVQLRPRDVTARIALSDLLEDLGRDDEALPLLELAYSQAPDDPRLPERLGPALRARQRYAEADVLLTRAVRNDPTNVTLLKLSARTKERLGRLEEACDLYGRVLQSSPDNTDVRFTRGELFARLGRWNEAYLDLSRAAQEDPASFETQYNLGVVLLQMGTPDVAEPALLRALELQPENANVYYALGHMRRNQGRFSQAADYYRRGLVIDPNNALCKQGLNLVQQMFDVPPAPPNP